MALEAQTDLKTVFNGSNIFDAPSLPYPRLLVEFCDRCRWLHRATWIQTELFITFPPPSNADDEPGLAAIALLPARREDTAGRWRIWLATEAETLLLWDRKQEGGFGDLKELKQRIRDKIRPGHSLGHSDKHA